MYIQPKHLKYWNNLFKSMRPTQVEDIQPKHLKYWNQNFTNLYIFCIKYSTETFEVLKWL